MTTAEPLTQQTQQRLADRLKRVWADTHPELSPASIAQWERCTCRACGRSQLVDVLCLGDQPPANAFLSPGDTGRRETRFPLSVRLCENCGMLQLAHVVPPEMLFRAYSFFTSSSNRMGEHFSMLMGRFVEESVPSGGLVVEIGSNDGTALASLRHRRVRVLGIDPARNVSVMAASRGVPTITEFFSEPLAAEIARTAGPASLIVACNVLGHIDDLDDVCRGIQRLLDPTGTFVFEVPYLGDLIERAEFDTIYHEHLSYFAVRPLVALFQRHGLALTRVEHFPVHGGTIRGTVVRGETLTDSVRRRIECEERMQLAEPSTFARLDERMRQTRESLRSWLQMQRDAGLTVWGYGAPAKGTVLLNYCGIDTELLPAVVDSTPMKQGLRVPGTRQPIFPPGALTVQKAQRALILAWNHAAEITARECEFQTAGGRLFTPDLREWKHEPGGVEFFGDTPGGFRQSLDVDVY